MQVGPLYGNDWFIADGLKPGDVLVIDGVARLTPGAAVKAVEAPPKAAGADSAKPAPAAKAAPPAKM